MRQRVFAVVVFVLAAASPVFAAGYRTASWMPLYNSLALSSTQTNAGRLTESNPAWYQFQSNGTIVKMNGAEAANWRAAMTGTEVIPTVQNLVDGSFDKTVAVNAISAANREAHAESIFQVVVTHGYDGIDLDYENLPYSSSADFVAFVNILANKLHGAGKKLSVTVYAKKDGTPTWDGEGGHDYVGIGAAADYVKLMLYPFTYSGKPAGPIAPLDWIDRVLTYTKTVMPASKIVVGLPWYGKDWVGTAATSISYTEMTQRATANNAVITRDSNGEAVFAYGANTVYFVDAYAYERKIDFVLSKHPDVGGFAHWASGEEDPGVWKKVEALKLGQVTVATAPVAPTALAATTSGTALIIVTWTDNSSNENGFSLERCTGPACTSFSQIGTLNPGSTAYYDSSVAEGTTYTYRVRAYNNVGSSGYSNVGAATTLTTSMPAANNPAGNALIPAGSMWRYLDNGSDQGTAWASPAFNDGSWKAGAGQLGYGDGDEKTVVNAGPGPKYITTYFRYSFNVTSPAAFSALKLRLIRDDGAVVYLNGREVFRSNMPSGTIGYATLASGDATNESAYNEASIDPALLVAGRNVIAVEIHQSDPYSSDISFEADLTATSGAATPAPPSTLIASGSQWKYLDNGSNQGTAWRAPSFADTSWRYGSAQFGYGDGDEKTVVGYGSSSNRYVTTYFRRAFNVADPAALNSLLLRVLRDDAAVVYINGVEVFRCGNTPAGAIGYRTYAKYALSGSEEATFVQKTLSPTVLVKGTNTIAVEIHQSDASSSDLSFDLSLAGQ